MTSTLFHLLLVSLLLMSLRTACGQCAPKDIFIGQTTWKDRQEQTVHTVVIANVGPVSVTDVHVWCDDFNPKDLIEKTPGVFKKEGRGDCLVNEGGMLNRGDSVTFDYVSEVEFKLYPISVKC